jgi:hypothetical protein
VSEKRRAGLPGPVTESAAAVGPNPRPVQRHLIEANQAQLHGYSSDLSKQILKFPFELRAKITERRVVDGPSLYARRTPQPQ